MKKPIEFKITAEVLIALIQGKKLSLSFDGKVINIIPPLYDGNDRFKYAFESGREFQKQADIFLTPHREKG